MQNTAEECHLRYIDRSLAQYGCAEHTGQSSRKNLDSAQVQPLGTASQGQGTAILCQGTSAVQWQWYGSSPAGSYSWV